ncbi:MAG: serine/threonine-protein kinase [Planctomycetota bacterium]
MLLHSTVGMAGPEANEDQGDDATRRSAEDVAADVYDFVADYLEDRDQGRERPLSEYLGRYPGAQAEVALEYLRMTGVSEDGPVEVDGVPGSAAEPSAGDEQRIGRYRLLRALGRGGQGEVWLARDERLGRDVALKLLTAVFVTEERRARFRREAESIARLEHPGLAQVLEADIDGSMPYIAMRYVQGVDLGSSFDQARDRASAIGPVLPWIPRDRAEVRRVLGFFERCARALHAAHEAGVVHRDVKPGNIMVTPDGRPVLLDFGLAREEVQGDASSLTREGDVFGTLAYMAPEQLRGAASEIDSRSDVWALGVTLFEALTGARPFEGRGPGDLAIAIDSGRSKDPHALNPNVTTDVRVVLETALERSRERRYSDALALAEDLRRIREYEPIRARPAGPALRLRRWTRREPAWAAALVVTLVALVGGLVASQYALRNERALNARILARSYCAEVPAFQAKAPSGALALGLEAVRLEDTWATRSSLYPPLLDLTLARQFELPEARVWDVELVGEDRIAACGNGGAIRVFDLQGTVAPVARHDLDADVRALHADRERGTIVVGTADGRVLALRSADLTVTWSASAGEGPVLDLAVADGMVVALVGADELIALDADGGARIARLDAPEGGLGALRATRQGDRVVATGRAFHGSRPTTSRVALLLSAPTLEVVARLEHGAPVRDAAIAEGAGRIATIDAGGRVGLFDLHDGAPIDLRVDIGDAVRAGGPGASVAVDADGRSIAIGTDAGDASCVESWVVDERGDAVAVARRAWSAPAGARVVDLEFSPEGWRLAAASWDQRVRILDVVTGGCDSIHAERNNPTRVSWSPRGDRLVSIGISWTVELWRTEANARAFRLPPVAEVPAGDARASQGEDAADAAIVWGAFTHDGRRVVLLDALGRAALFEASAARGGPDARQPGTPVLRLDAEEDEAVAALVAVADAAPRAVWVDARGRLRAIDTDRGALVAEALLPQTAPVDGLALGGSIRALSMSPDGGAVGLVDAHGVGWTWRPGEDPVRVERPTADAEPAPFRVVDFGPASRAAYFADASGAVLRHVPSDPDATFAFTDPPVKRASALDIAVSPDGLEVVVALERYDLQCWNAETGEATRSPGKAMHRRWVEYFRDGRFLSCASGAGTAAVIRSDGGGDVGQAIYHDGPITSCAVADEDTFVTGSIDRTVFVWSAASGEALARAAVHSSPVLWVATSRGDDGTRVLSCAADGAVVWPVDVLGEARRRAPRDLSIFERRELEALLGGGS